MCTCDRVVRACFLSCNSSPTHPKADSLVSSSPALLNLPPNTCCLPLPPQVGAGGRAIGDKVQETGEEIEGAASRNQTAIYTGAQQSGPGAGSLGDGAEGLGARRVCFGIIVFLGGEVPLHWASSVRLGVSGTLIPIEVA